MWKLQGDAYRRAAIESMASSDQTTWNDVSSVEVYHPKYKQDSCEVAENVASRVFEAAAVFTPAFDFFLPGRKSAIMKVLISSTQKTLLSCSKPRAIILKGSKWKPGRRTETTGTASMEFSSSKCHVSLVPCGHIETVRISRRNSHFTAAPQEQSSEEACKAKTTIQVPK